MMGQKEINSQGDVGSRADVVRGAQASLDRLLGEGTLERLKFQSAVEQRMPEMFSEPVGDLVESLVSQGVIADEEEQRVVAMKSALTVKGVFYAWKMGMISREKYADLMDGLEGEVGWLGKYDKVTGESFGYRVLAGKMHPKTGRVVS